MEFSSSSSPIKLRSLEVGSFLDVDRVVLVNSRVLTVGVASDVLVGVVQEVPADVVGVAGEAKMVLFRKLRVLLVILSEERGVSRWVWSVVVTRLLALDEEVGGVRWA